MTRRKRQQSHSRPPGLLPALAVAGVVVLIGLAAAYVLTGRSGSGSPSPSDQKNQAAVTWSDITPPEYVLTASQDVQMAYRFALDRPDVMMWMACYCGCGQHADHKNARNCFISNSTTSGEPFDPHGSGCAMCVGIALDVKTLTGQGRSLQEIRAFIDEKYGSQGGGTDTPLPPA